MLAVVAQFTVGYLMEESGGQGRGRGRGGGGESGHGRGRGGDADPFGDDTLLTVHVVLGVSILLLVAVRVWWRRRASLAPWPPQLTMTGRKLEHAVEIALYVLLATIPLTGLWLVFVNDDAVFLHVSAQLAFLAVLAVHLGVVARYRLLRRML